MADSQNAVLETGVFASPATGADAPYQLTQHPSGQLMVTCLTSGTNYDVSVLAIPTHAAVDAQRRAFIRELAAWLSTNGPDNPPREQMAVSEVSRLLSATYTAEDLASDRAWIASNDLSKRVKILKNGLSEQDRLGLVEFAARVGAAGTGVSETDAQFIEILGVGLGLDRDVVMNTVVAAIQAPSAA